MPTYFRLPKTLETWPWPRQINPFYDEVKAESAAWFRSFQAFSTESQKAFDLCDFTLLASLAYPTLSKECLRTSSDMMNLFFVFDEYTDNVDASTVRMYADIVMDALRHPQIPRSVGECVLGEVARQFWEHGITTASETSQRRFIETFQEYTDAVVQQAADRDVNCVRTVEEYLALRRKTIGAEPSYVPHEFCMDLPDELFCHPAVVMLSRITTDLIILGNDLCSYNKEQAAGDDLHNIISIAMNDLRLDLDNAMCWLEQLHAELVDRFMVSWEEVQEVLQSAGAPGDAMEYVQGLANWVRANDCWNFESGRYFGSQGKNIQAHRVVVLREHIA